MKPLFIPLAAAILAGPALAQQVIPAQSEISFVSRQMGVPVEGKFKQWTAQISFDPRQAAAGKVGFSIQTGSASFGAPETDAELPKASWFNAARFPTASFASSSIQALGGGRFDVRGTLSIKGSSQAVVVPVQVTQAGGTSTASGSFTIQRLAFQIGEGEWADTSMVANDVTVKFKLALRGMAPL
jgi:polyisoprenoid-binding protein YceI